MVRLSLNSIALEPNRWNADKHAYFKLETLLPHVAAAGFGNLELWQYHISRRSVQEVRQVRSMALDLGLSFPIIGAYPRLHLAGTARQKESRLMKRLLEYAEILGAQILKIFVGDCSARVLPQKEYDRSVQFMRELVRLAAEHNLTITGETHENTLFDTLQSCKQFLQDVGAANFKICYQPIDFHSTEKAIHDFRALAPEVIHLHFQGRVGNAISLLQNAEIDYEAFLTAVAQVQFRGHFCLEFVKGCIVETAEAFDIQLVLENAKKDRDFLLRIAAKNNLTVAA